MSRRSVVKGALAASATGQLLQAQVAMGQPIGDYIDRYVHPELRAMARASAEMSKQMPVWTPAILPQIRKGTVAFGRRPLASPALEKRSIASANRPALPVLIVNAKPGESRPAILHMHGGGYVTGAAEMNAADLQDICQALDCVAVSVDYRLAPETTYAGSIEDNYAALKWLHANAGQLGADPTRIAVMGESAGGGHAAILAITARDRGEVPIAFQCLVYPMLDDRTGSIGNVPDHVGRLIWTPESNRFGWRSFLGMAPGGRSVPARAVPARTTDLAGLPSAFIGVGALDLFCDEDVDYAQRLNAVKVPAELIVVAGAFHGFDTAPARISQWFNAAKLDALRRGLGIAA